MQRYYSFFYDERKNVTADMYPDLDECAEDRDKWMAA